MPMQVFSETPNIWLFTIMSMESQNQITHPRHQCRLAKRRYCRPGIDPTLPNLHCLGHDRAITCITIHLCTLTPTDRWMQSADNFTVLVRQTVPHGARRTAKSGTQWLLKNLPIFALVVLNRSHKRQPINLHCLCDMHWVWLAACVRTRHIERDIIQLCRDKFQPIAVQIICGDLIEFCRDPIELCRDLIELCRDLIELCRDIISTNHSTDKSL